MLELDKNDDIEFVHRIRSLIVGALRESTAAQVYIVKVDHWFGPRWIYFSHKTLGALGVRSTDLRVPPFVPGRIRSEMFYERTGDELVAAEAPLVLHVEQTSEANARRRTRDLCPGAAMFWWTGQTLTSGRGTLMAYMPGTSGHLPWYVELKKAREWQYGVTSRISVPQLDRLVSARARSSS